ncbi:MAG: hypothetical protein R3185_06090, partial [Candidatus Thermoplasmatota archaeon]|nr:hypothetical protein [Candidatus Thermoplasmatota archaeon]
MRSLIILLSVSLALAMVPSGAAAGALSIETSFANPDGFTNDGTPSYHWQSTPFLVIKVTDESGNPVA